MGARPDNSRWPGANTRLCHTLHLSRDNAAECIACDRGAAALLLPCASTMVQAQNKRCGYRRSRMHTQVALLAVVRPPGFVQPGGAAKHVTDHYNAAVGT